MFKDAIYCNSHGIKKKMFGDNYIKYTATYDKALSLSRKSLHAVQTPVPDKNKRCSCRLSLMELFVPAIEYPEFKLNFCRNADQCLLLIVKH